MAAGEVNVLGFGLFSIMERSEMLGGRLTIDSAPGSGCRVTMLIPSMTPEILSGIAASPDRADEQPQEDKDRPVVTERCWRVMLVDDQPVIRRELAALFSDVTGIEVVGEADNGSMAIDKIPSCWPDVVLMDFSMPEMNGAEATRVIKRLWPEIRVIGLSMLQAEDVAPVMLEAGAEICLNKEISPDDLVGIICGGKC